MSHEGNFPIEPLALFGGTFDPVHYGHLRCADEVRHTLGLRNLFLLPAGKPVHRATPLATVEERLQMLQLALREFPFLSVEESETRRNGPSYMVDTLRELHSGFPQRTLMLLIGQDAANLLHSWYEWEQLFRFAHIIIMTRPDSTTQYRHDVAKQIQRRLVLNVSELSRSKAGKVLPIAVTAIDISATSIKKTIRQGRSAKFMLPDSVLDYINENQLYLSA